MGIQLRGICCLMAAAVLLPMILRAQAQENWLTSCRFRVKSLAAVYQLGAEVAVLAMLEKDTCVQVKDILGGGWRRIEFLQDGHAVQGMVRADCLEPVKAA